MLGDGIVGAFTTAAADALAGKAGLEGEAISDILNRQFRSFRIVEVEIGAGSEKDGWSYDVMDRCCLLYTSPSPRD